jgi:prepilin-type N-terminal cleavage/methylation domain-containing protein
MLTQRLHRRSAPADTGLGADTRGGFTLVEIMVALVLLAVAFLGVSMSTGRLVRSVAQEEVRAVVQQAVEDRITEIRMDPRYGVLDSIYSGTESPALGLQGYTRTTEFTRIRRTQSGGGVEDYWEVWVTVTGPFAGSPLSRQIVVAAP